MADAPSFADLEAQGRAEQIIHRPDLLVVEGDVSEMLIKTAAAMADRCTHFAAQLNKETFLDGASGDALTQLVNDHWGLERFAAVEAQGQVVFTRPGPGAAGTILAGTTVATAINVDGQDFRFVTDTDLSFLAADTSKSVGVTAQVAGPESNVDVSGITRILDTVFDTSFSVTNTSRTVGGADAEKDSELKERARLFPSTLARGTAAALEFGAKQVAAVKIATAVDNGGQVDLIVSDIDGNSSLQMVSDVEAEIINWKCAGSAVSIVGGSPFSQNVDYTIAVKSGVSAAALETDIAQAITSAIGGLTLNETLTISCLITAIKNVDIDGISDVVINTPAGNVTPTNQVIRVGTITRT